MLRTPLNLRAPRAALGALVLAVALLGAACAPPAGMAAPVNDLIVRHNDVRVAAGVAALTVDPKMNQMAQFHANRMAFFAKSPCALFHSSGTSLYKWYPTSLAAGENIGCVAGCPGSNADLMNMWLSSGAHASIILNPGYHFIGAGATCKNGVMYVAVHFRS